MSAIAMAITVSIAMSIVFILSIERQRSPSAHFVRRKVERLVGPILDLPSAGFVSYAEL